MLSLCCHGNRCHGNAAGGMAAASWLLMLCLVRERPAEHLPITADDSCNDAGQLDKKVSKHIFQQHRHL